ncbi:MAG TPA: Gfo/Idh/MocA family oxidoreductase [Geminicoccaceae bacterium]|nr:Gfo/Idh/MocA family oxidoreductase [Geminicoccaceae bacterium]
MPHRRRIAIIGLGMAVTPHARSLLDLADRVEVAGAFSRSASRRRAFAERFDLPLADDLDAIAGDGSVSAVMILTPPDTHLELVERFANAGKHILLEKPLERSTDRAEKLVAAAKATGVRLGVVFQHRFREASQALRARLDEGALGELACANVICPWWRPQSYYDEPGRGTLARDGGGVLITQAIHTLDLLLSLTGPVAEVAAIAGTTGLHRMETEDFAGAGLHFANGAYGALLATTAAFPGFAERIELIGTRATAVLYAGSLALHHQDGRTERVSEEQATGAGADPMAFPHDAHRALLADFLDALDQGRDPRASGREALKVHRFIDAVLRASAEGRTLKVANG